MRTEEILAALFRLCRPSRKSAALILVAAMAGCAQTPAPQVTQPERINVPDFEPAKANGSIFQRQRGYMPLFEDRRPRRMGDILTIVLNEQVSASKNSESSASRSASASLSLDELPDALDTLAEYGFDLTGESEFNGGGGSSANNTFTGTITVTVEEVLANGNLVVRGEKQIAINQGTEYIRFSGVVNPRAITGQSSVASSQVASARIEYLGDGYINAAQKMGWLQRFFLTVSPF